MALPDRLLKQLSLLGFCLALTLAFSGCARMSKAGRGDSAGLPVSIQLSAWGSMQEAEILRGLVRDFERDHPQVRVNFLHIPDNYYQKLHLLIAGDLAPDVMLTNSLNFPVYAAHGAFLDLGPRLAADSAIHARDFYPAALQAFTWRFVDYKNRPTTISSQKTAWAQNAFSGETLPSAPQLDAIPRDISNLVVFYNRDWFRKAGVSEPVAGWTWDDLKRTAAALTRDTNGDGRTDVFGFSFYAKPPLFWLPFVWSAGGELLSADLKHCLLNEPAAIRGLQFYSDLRNRWHVAPQKADSGDAAMSQLFLQQKLAMMVSGRWSVPVLREQARFHWDVAPLPVGPSGKSRVGIDGSGYAISAKTRHPNEAWALVRFLSSRQAIARVAASGLIVPARPDVAESGGLFPNSGLVSGAVPPPAHGRVFLDIIPDGVPSRTPPRWNEFSEELQLALEPVWDGVQPAKSAIDAARPRLQRILEEGSP